MSAAVTQAITSFLAQGQNLQASLRPISRGSPLEFTVDLEGFDDDVIAAQDEWVLEIHENQYPPDDALISINGTVDEDEDEITFTLTGDQTDLDLDGEKNHHFWVVVYSLDGTEKTVWLVGWLPVWESNISASSIITTIVSVDGAAWLAVGGTGLHAQLLENLPDGGAGAAATTLSALTGAIVQHNDADWLRVGTAAAPTGYLQLFDPPLPTGSTAGAAILSVALVDLAGANWLRFSRAGEPDQFALLYDSLP